MKNLVFAAGAAVAIAGLSANGQDLYDTSVLRTFNITFADANWEQLLRANYASETLLEADLEIDGEVYEDVGVRIRGNTSYVGLPNGSQKFSLKIKMDFVDEDQELLGYDTVNLNNAFTDPTFCREVVYNNYVAQFIPHPRANHALVTINGENWGVYVNTQQPDKDMLRDYFEDEDGVRIKCANNPNGPGLRYFGTNQSSYSAYEIQNDGGLADPWAELIEASNVVTNGDPLNWETEIDPIFAVDPSIWSLVCENMLSDDDSYVNKGCDFMTYQNPIDGRMHLLQRDANETFKGESWSYVLNFGSSTKPVLSNVLDAPELRQRYMAHYRTILQDMSWDTFGPEFLALRDMIDPYVQADPKRLYGYDDFQDNFTSTVNIGGGPGPGGGGNVIGLEQFFDQREALLLGTAELVASGPIVMEPVVSDESPDASEDVYISAEVGANGSAVDKVELFFRVDATTTYQCAEMLDDGLSGDGAAGDGVYGVLVPVSASSGQRVDYYVMATADNAYGSLSFMPELSELAPASYSYTFGSTGGMRITEWAYSADSGEFVEFTNMSDLPVDMTGYSYDDDNAVAGEFDLSSFGVVAPGESVVLTDGVAEDFHGAWSLDSSVKIIGELGVVTGSNLGRNDQINLFDASGNLVDRLSYGDEDYEGSVRTRDASGQACVDYIGQDDVLGWVLSEDGDMFGSFATNTGEYGTPGSYNMASCGGCVADLTGDGVLDFFDISAFISAFGSQDPIADMTGDGNFDFFDVSSFIGLYSAGCP